MKKVLYICPNGYLGGAETFVLNVCRLHNEGEKYNPTILFLNSGQALDLAQSLGIDTVLLKRTFRLLNPIKLFLASFEMRNLVKEGRYDVIHFTMPYSVIASFLLFFLRDIKKIWFQHGPVGGKLDFIASFFPIDALLFNSSYTREKHLDSTPCYTQQLAVLPLGVKIPELRKIEPKEKLQIICVGRICEGKNQSLLLKTFHSLLLKNPDWSAEKVVLSFIGSAMSPKDKVYAQNLFDYVATNQLNKNIHFLQHQKEMSHVYLSADILVHLPQNPEAFGLVLAEAMSYKVSVVASPKGGSQDVIADSQVATLVKTSEELEDLLEISIRDHLDPLKWDEVEMKRQQAYLYIQEKFSEQVMIKRLEDIYDSLFFR